MNAEDLECIKSNDIEGIKAALARFNDKHAKLFDFTEFNATGQWPAIWKAVFRILHNRENQRVFPECLSCIRILSRDKTYLNAQIDTKEFDSLLDIAYLSPERKGTLIDGHTQIAIEALKCLCNLVFQSTKCQDLCAKNSASEGILKRVNCDKNFPFDMEFFDMKLLFLITALKPSTRAKVRDDLNGLAYLTEWLDEKIKAKDLSDPQIDLIGEILKVLFNITGTEVESPSDEHEIEHRRIVSIIRKILFICSDLNTGKQCELVSHAVNLLTNIPLICYTELMIGKSAAEKSGTLRGNFHLYEEKCVAAVDVLLNFLKLRFDNVIPNSPGSLHELLSPILTVLVKCVRSNRTLRHYIRSVILPPLKNVSQRPEQGDEVRNHLCRFLTTPEKQIRDLASDLLFVCCKENVARMIKHTGYGNAAGFLANRGLLGGRSNPAEEYSSDSEDSDTEEYKELQHGINPVLGCFEPPKANPLEGMSDEQKEYEAVKLANLMDQLHRQGLVQPCRIGDDGRPQAVDHIMQLQEELPQQQIDAKMKK